jgi:hypothetical protein
MCSALAAQVLAERDEVLVTLPLVKARGLLVAAASEMGLAIGRAGLRPRKRRRADCFSLQA